MSVPRIVNRFSISPKLTKISEKNTTFAIFSDEPIRGMKSSGCKSLIEIENQYLIDIQISQIRKAYPSSEIILLCGYDSSRIIKYVISNKEYGNIRIIENHNYEQYNSIESAKIVVNATINQNIIFVPGELIFSYENLKNLVGNNALYTSSNIDKDSIGVVYEPINIVKTTQAVLTNMNYAMPNKFSGLCSFNAESFFKLKTYLNAIKNKKMFIYQSVLYIAGLYPYKVINDDSIYRIEK